MIKTIYTSGDVLRGITERVEYYERFHNMIVHDLRIEGDEVVIDFTFPNKFQEAFSVTGHEAIEVEIVKPAKYIPRLAGLND